MSETAEPVPAPPAAPPRPRRRWARWVLGALAGLVALAVALLLAIDTAPGHAFIAGRIGALTPSNGLRYSIGRIEGSIYGRATLHDVRISDPKGLVFAAPVAQLDWRPFAWLRNRLDIRSLHIPRAGLFKLPEPKPTGRKGPILPGFDIAVGKLQVDALWIAPKVAGQKRRARILGNADVRRGRALVNLGAEVQGSDTLRIRLDTEPDRDRFDIDIAARGRSDGVISHLAKLNRPVAVQVAGDGRWSRWQGRALAIAGSERLIDLALTNQSGAYALRGDVAPGVLLKGGLQRLVSPRVAVDATTTFDNRRFDGRFTLRSPALSVEGEGGVDLRTSSFRNFQLTARLLQPGQLVKNMDGRNVELRMVLDGGFDDGRFDYRLGADRLVFDGRTGIENILAAGTGRISKPPIDIPVHVTARRVTGVGDVAGGILANLGIDGALRADGNALVGNDLRLKSDKLNGLLTLFVDLKNGRYEIGLNGGLKRYLIPGLGIVDLDSRLTVVPGEGGHGMRVVGRGVAQMVRLDNAFFRSLTKGLPRIETALERGPDGIMHFKGLRLTSPGLRLAGNGYRRKDGTFHFEGAGDQSSYGPLTLLLDGKIEKPSLKLRFARPNDAMGLKDVDATLTPTADGFAFTASGGSRLGDFTGDGAILLPRGGQSAVRVDRLDVSGTRARGLLNVVDGGFAGDVAFTGGGLDGQLHFAPQGSIQGIQGQVTAQRASLGPGMSVRRAQASFDLLLDPEGTSVTAKVQAGGVSTGSVRIGRLVADVQMRGGDGTVKASFSGSRGRAFAIDTVTQISGGTYTVNAQGTVDRRPIKLETPAVLTTRNGAWELAATKLSFSGGNATLSGSFGANSVAVDAALNAMPLSVMDIVSPGLGLSGSATGTLSYANRPGTAEQGRIDMRVRGLSRSGLVLSSSPVDLGIAGVMSGDRAGARAVIVSGGKVIGRAQMRLSPISDQGALLHRLINAPAIAQLRYAGPADTLWRLTGIELFDLSGPISIGADVSGRLAEPIIRGSVRSTNARLESATMGTVLTNLSTQGTFTGSQLVLERFSANDGKGGSVSGNGTFDLAAAHGFGIELSLDAKNALLIDRDDIGAAVTGAIKISSDGSGGTISGDVRLDTARYQLGKAVAANPIPKLNVTEINLPLGSGSDDADEAVQPWQLQLTARTTNLRVTGLGLSSLWSARLTIKGEPTNPAIGGQADLIRGDYEFAGRTFDLQRGIIRFDGRAPANPTLDIAAAADAEGLSATIKVTGNAEKPDISFASVPALPEDELLSRLLFGTSITNLSAPEAIQLAAAVAALNSSDGGLNPINAVRNAVGLDRLRILPADPVTGAQTAVAAGKYITRRAYAEIITDGAGYSATRVEYRVTRWLSLLASISTIGRQSASVRVSKDY